MNKNSKPHKNIWIKIWLYTVAFSILYYVIKTLIFKHTSTAVDAVIMAYGMVSLIVYLYFFYNKKEKDEK